MKESISIKLVKTLLKGKEKLGKEALESISVFVDSQHLNDYSFMDRGGRSDTYYTFFGWMLSYVLRNRMSQEKMHAYIAKQYVPDLDLVHYASFMRCRMLQHYVEKGRIGRLLNHKLDISLKGLQDFTSYPNNDMYAPYTQYLWLSLMEDAGMKNPDRKTVLDRLERYRVPGGGYANTEDAASSSINATAAALSVRGQLESYRTNEDVFYLRDQQGPSGGYCAVPSAPVPDLLSTATALFVLDCYGLKPAFDAREFIEAHWLASGGFSATLLDENSDVEYTFYGLLALGTI